MAYYRVRILTPEIADLRYLLRGETIGIDAEGLAALITLVETGRLSEDELNASIQATVDSTAISLNGNQTIGGTKTFLSPIVLPDNSLAMSKVSGLSSTLTAKADLIDGKIPASQVPAFALGDVFVVNSEAAMLATDAGPGDIAIRTDTSKTFVLSTSSPTTLADWKEMTASGTVTSVAGRVGNVALTSADVGLGQVNNTSDTNKPVSTLQQAAINLKADDSVVVKLAGAQTIAGVKTFSSAPVVPDSSFVIAKIAGLQTALDAKADDSLVIKLSGAQTVAGVKTFSSAPVVPDSSFVIAKIAGLQAALDAKAPLVSPALTGNPTVPTQSPGDNSTRAANTAFVTAAVAAGGGGGGGGSGNMVAVHYNGVAWPAFRPATSDPIMIISTKYDGVPDPGWQLLGDMRIRSFADMEAL